MEMDGSVDAGRRFFLSVALIVEGVRTLFERASVDRHQYRPVLGHLGSDVVRPESRPTDSHYNFSRLAAQRCMCGSTGRHLPSFTASGTYMVLSGNEIIFLEKLISQIPLG